LLALTEKMTDDDTKYQELLLYPVSGHSSSPIAAIFEVEGETHEQEQAVALRGLCDRGGGRADLRFGYFSSIRRSRRTGCLGERKVYRAEQAADAAVTPGAAPVALQATVDKMKNHQLPELQDGMVFQLKNGDMYQLNNGQLLALQNGYVLKLKNGGMLQLQNGQLYRLNAGQLLAIKNEMRFQLQTGQMLQIQNGQMLALNNGQMFQLSNGQMFQLNNGQLFQLNNGMLYQLNNGQIQAAMKY